MTALLASFTEVAAWFWSEIGLLLAFIIKQPILLLSMSLFFVGGHCFLFHPCIPFRIGGVKYGRIIRFLYHGGGLVLERDRSSSYLDPGSADLTAFHVPVLHRGDRILFYPGVPLGLICPGLRPRIPEVPYD